MEPYSPFDKAITELNPSDLSVLAEVHEGWYVEYKREAIPPRGLAKAIAAFANSHGGWLILGVEDRESEDSSARTFPGLDDIDVQNTLQHLRQGLNERVSPVPHFDSVVLRGPCDEISLTQYRSIVLVHVPESHNAPHVDRDGRLYTRVADSSEPKPLTDRYLMEQLWHRTDRARQLVEQWVDRDLECSEGETEVPFLRLMFSPDLWHKRHRMSGLSRTELQTAFAARYPGEIIVPLDAIYPTGNGFIARQYRDNDPRRYTLTLHVYDDFSCDAIVPLSQYVGDATALQEALGSYYHLGDRFVQMLQDQSFLAEENPVHLGVVDLNVLLYALIGVTRQYRAVLRLAGVVPEFYFKAQVLHCWRKVAFIDAVQILKRFADFGIPTMMSNRINTPPGDTPESFILLRNEESQESGADRRDTGVTSQALTMFLETVRAFGITGILPKKGEPDDGAMMEIAAAGGRAMGSNLAN